MKEEYEPMNCPVCNDFYFSELQEGDDPDKLQCLICGWRYDNDQLNAPDELGSKNSMSLNEYRKWYEQKIGANPNYRFIDDNIPKSKPHTCPVCSKYRFKDESCYDICPFCGWEDDGSEQTNNEFGANGISIAEYRKQYHELVKANPDYVWKQK